MRIDEDLNLVINIREDDKGPEVVCFHTPISRSVFEANYRILAATKAALAVKGPQYQAGSGPFIAALALKDEARKDAIEIGDVDEEGKPGEGRLHAFMAELKRLTVVLAPTPQGWDQIPVDSAIAQGLIDEDEWSDTESSIVFFTCHYAVSRKAERRKVAMATISLLDALGLGLSGTSSSAMEYADFLQKLRLEKASAAAES